MNDKLKKFQELHYGSAGSNSGKSSQNLTQEKSEEQSSAAAGKSQKKMAKFQQLHNSGGFTVTNRNDGSDAFVKSFLRDSQNYIRESADTLNRMGWKEAAGADRLTARAKAADNMKSRAAQVRTFLEDNRDDIDPDRYSMLTAYLDDFNSDSESIGKAFDEEKAYYSQWDTEEDYNSYLKYQKDLEEARHGTAQKQYEEFLQSEDYKKEVEESRQRRIQEAKENEQGYSLTGYIVTEDYYDTIRGESKTAQELKAKADYQAALLQRDEDYQIMAKDMAEFESWPEEDQAALKTWIIENDREKFDLNGYYAKGQARTNADALFQKYGEQKVREMAESYGRWENERTAQEIDTMGREAVEGTFWESLGPSVGHSILTVGANLAGSLTAPAGYIGELTGRTGRYQTMDPNNAGTIFNQYSGAVRDQVAKNIEGENGNELRKAGSYLYQGAMSAADSAARLLASGGREAMSLGLAATGAFGQSMSKYSAQGATPGKAMLMATVDAGLEAATEKLPLDNLMNIAKGGYQGIKQTLVDILTQAGTEVVEEEVSFLGSLIMEAVVLQEKSAYSQSVAEKVAGGMSYQEAKEAADWELVKEAAETAAVSAMSGGMSAGGGVAFGAAAQNITQNTEKHRSSKIDKELTKQVAKDIDPQKIPQTLEEIEEEYGAFGETVRKAYMDGQDIREFAVGFRSAYEIGRQGGSEKALSGVQNISQSQREIAFSLGRDAAEIENRSQKQNGGIAASLIGEDGSSEDVTIDEIVSMNPDQMKLRLEDGRTVTDDQLSFSGDKEVLNKVWELGMDVESANTIMAESAASTATDTEQAAGIQEAYHYGSNGYSMEQLTQYGSDAAVLTDNQRKAAWQAGRNIHLQRAAAAPGGGVKISGKTAGVWFDAGGGNVIAFDSADTSGLSKAAVAGAQAAQVLQKLGIGKNYYFYESYVNDKGERVYKDSDGVERKAHNGWYEKSDGSIHIDLNAGADGNGLTLFTLSHELTHFVEQWSPKKYQALADFLVANYGKGASVDELVTAKQAELSESRGTEVSYEEAYSEFIADSMEAMLADSNVMEKLTELKKTDRNLFDKIREFFDNLAQKIREIYKDLKPDSEEGKAVLEMKDQIEQIQQMFAEALADAGGNFQAASEVGLEVDMETESIAPSILYSERTWSESDYVQERKKAAEEIHKAIGVSVKKAEDYIDSVNSIAKMIAEDRTRLDYFSSPGRSSFIGNVEYGGSFDFSTLCKKRRLLTGTFTAIQKALPNTALTADEILDIRNRMKKAKLEVSCGLCYVEGSRANMGQFSKEFLRLYKQYYPDAWQPNMADVNTPDGIEWVRINHPECYEQYEYFWNHYGTLKEGDKNLFASQQKPKLYQLHTEYKGEILQKFKDDENVEEKNLNGGIRLQSFSDFEIVHLIDTMQIIMDMSRVGLAGQAYTKVPDFAWALGDTGLKINLSLIAKGVDADGKLVFDDVEGMPITEAMRLRDRYSKNVGTILVAFNDEQLMAAMADDRVDFIIPFHRSQWKKSQYEAMGLPAKTKDYTYMQNEKFIKPQYHEYRGRMVKDKATNYMPNEYWDFSKSGKENAAAYLEMCARNNKRPKFYKLLQNNGDGSYSLKADGSTDGYWKLLIDFKMYDNDGVGSPQTSVKPDFNMEEATRMLTDYKGGHSSFPVAQGIVDDFVKEYKQNHDGRQFSDRKKADTPQQTEQKALLEDKYYARQIDKWDGRDHGGSFRVGKVSEPLLKVGIPDVDIWFDQSKAAKQLDVKEEVTKDVLKKIPYLLEHPIAISESYDNTVMVFGEMYDENGNPIVVALRVNSTNRRNHITLVNKIRSVGTRTHNLDKLLSDDAILYLNETKKETNRWFNALGRSTPFGGTKFGLIRSISFDVAKSNIVGTDSKNISSAENRDERQFSDRKQSGASDRNAPAFYSYMGLVVNGVKQEKLGAASVVNMLRGKGVKAEEIKWSGIEEWLDGKKSVTKAELQEFIAGSMLQIEEEKLSDAIQYTDEQRRQLDDLEEETFQKWDEASSLWLELFETDIPADVIAASEPGQRIQRKVEYSGNGNTEAGRQLIQLGHGIDRLRTYIEVIADDARKESHGAKWGEYKLDGGANYREILFRMPDSTYTNQAMKGHWGNKAKGILAHARIQDFDTDTGKMLFVEEIQSDWHNAGQKYGYGNADTEVKRLQAEYDALKPEYELLQQKLDDYNSRPNEYIEDYYEVYDQYMDMGHKLSDIQRRIRNTQKGRSGVAEDAPFKQNYHEYVLKRLIREAAENGYDSIGWTTADIQSERWSDDYAEGYRIEYDQDIPKFLNKYGKKWGTKVGKTEIDTDGKSTVVWTMPITQAMQNAVLNEGQVLYQDRSAGTSNRALLANAFEGLAQTPAEEQRLQEYRENVDLLNEQEKKLQDLRAQIRDISFGKGERDTKKLQALQEEATKTANRIDIYDKRLLRLEAAKPLQDVLEREREKARKQARQKGQEAMKNYREKRKESAAKKDARRKIRKTVMELDKILNRGNKKRNVKEGMKDFVATALASAEILFTDSYSNEDMIRNGVGIEVDARENRLIDETQILLQKRSDLYNLGAIGMEIDDVIAGDTEAYEKRMAESEILDKKIAENMRQLKGVFERERNRLNRATVSGILDDLAKAYRDLGSSEDQFIRTVTDERVYQHLLHLSEEIGGTLIQDMNLQQMQMVADAYTMVLTTVRNANKAFVDGRSVQEEAKQMVQEFQSRKIPTKAIGVVLKNLSDAVGWNYEKFYYALDRINSPTLTKLFGNLADSENITMRDVQEAKAFQMEMVEKYHYNDWKIDQKIDHTFVDNTGKEFRLTLGELMALYAYTRRTDADKHIEVGGFTFGKAALTNPEPASTYKLTAEQCEKITGMLTPEQKSFAEAMQKYLSETMGAKGNEVSMKLYGIKMFTEENYFPLHIAGEFKSNAQESQAKAEAGFQTMANAGFTHSRTKNATAPIVMEDFMMVWADHVNEMSRYHGAVPALEDIRRVMNYSVYSDAASGSVSVKAAMTNAYGKRAVEYFDNLYREANSSAVTDKMDAASKKMLSLFRKNSVAYSLSVVIQQPASIYRAQMLVDRKYFGRHGLFTLTNGVLRVLNRKKWNIAYEEMVKYAPGVTMAKEIGGFDTSTGGSIRSYLMDTEKSFAQSMKNDTIANKAGTMLGLVDNNPIANLPNVADKIAWIEMWEACKRETAAKNPKMGTRTDEFMQKVAERFTEVIRATQVYDSMFSKSPMLKSKSLAAQYLVSFMNEPNTVANMAEGALRNLESRDFKQAAKTATALITSIVVTNVLKSLVYTMRDDDEYETFLEKYLSAIAGNLISDITIFNYVPYARDVWSVVQGYDIERADMAIVSDAVNAVRKLSKLSGQDTSSMTEEELLEWDKSVTDASWGVAETFSPLFGIPLKNIRRDFLAAINAISIAELDKSRSTTKLSIRHAVEEAVWQGSKSNADRLYEALVSGDVEYVQRLKAGYESDSSYESAVRKALRLNDPRIKEMANARYEGDYDRLEALSYEIEAEGIFDMKTIKAAYEAERKAQAKEWGFVTEEDEDSEEPDTFTVFSMDEYYTAIRSGNAENIRIAKEALMGQKDAEDYLAHEAEDSIASGVTSKVKGEYLDADISKTDAISIMTKYGGKSRTEAEMEIKKWDFQMEYHYAWGSRDRCYRSGTISRNQLVSAVMDIEDASREEAQGYVDFLELEMKNEDVDITAAEASSYFQYAQPYGLGVEVWLDYKERTKGIQNDKDVNGKSIPYTAVQKIMQVINSLPISSNQKYALARSNGWAESTIQKYKTW